MTATAMVFHGAGQPLESVTFAKPSLGAGEAWVRVRLCTLCGSDLHTLTGRRSEPTPCVLGHEIVGEIEDLGPGGVRDVHGNALSVGDRVVWSVAASCGECFFCTHELPQKCRVLAKYGHLRIEPNRGPFGGLSTHCHWLPGTRAVRVPSHLPDEVAAPAMCATATVMTAFRAAGTLEPGSIIHVVGLGLLGLTACAIGRTRGGRVFATDHDSRRGELAIRFGAEVVATSPNADIFTETPGSGANAAFEFTGNTDATRTALKLLRIGGTLVLVGAVMPTDPLAIHPEQLVRRCLTIRGVHNYAPGDLAAAIDWLAEHHTAFPFRDVVERTFHLSAVQAAFDYAEHHKPIRVAVRP